MLDVHRIVSRKETKKEHYVKTTERVKSAEPSPLLGKKLKASLGGDYKLKDLDALSSTSPQVITRCLDRETPPFFSIRTPTISTKCSEVPLALNVSLMYLDIPDNRVGGRTFFCSVRQDQNISTRPDRSYCLRCQCLYGRLGVPLFPPRLVNAPGT